MSVCFLFITRSVSTTPVRVDSCALTSHVLLYALTPLTAYGARLIQRSCDVISFLMVFMCLLLSIFSTIRQYNEASSYILYYLVSLYTLRSTFFKLLFELHLTSLLDDSTSFVRLWPWAITLPVTLSKTNKSHA